MQPSEVLDLLSPLLGKYITDKGQFSQAWIKVDSSHLLEVCKELKSNPKMSFDFLRMIAGVDYGEEMELNYQLFSYLKQMELNLKVRVPKSDPKVPSVENIWAAANWYEREAFDLLGFEFQNHSDLRRILMPYDWDGFPLRKDYREKESYNGLPTTREYLTGMPKLPTVS